MLAGGAGFVGGLVLGSLWNGGFGGCGYRNGANGVISAIDTSAITDAINQVNNNVSNLAMQSSQQARCNRHWGYRFNYHAFLRM